jgi:hypothetical protein
MEARFIATADPTDDEFCTVYGVEFMKGEWQKVDAELADLLSTNATFEVRKSKAAGKE